MTTKTLEITNFVEFHAILSSKPLDVGRWIYRGHADSNWPLIPKKGRDKYHDACEEEMIKQWQTFSHFYLFEQNHMDTNSLNSWPCLAIAQHYGVPTRLLDWSDNPLVACFFALSDDQHANSNGALYAYRLNDKDLN